MIVNRIRFLPSLLLVILLGILPLYAWFAAGTDPVEVTNAASGLTSVTWAANVAPSGRLSVRIDYDLGNQNERKLDVRLPAGARYLAVDGTPLAADIGKYATTSVRGTATVTYELPGAVTRYRDGAVLQLAAVSDTTLDGDQAMFPSPLSYIDPMGYGNVPVYGALFVPGADGVTLSFLDLGSVRAAADSDAIRFVGVASDSDAPSIVATIPAAAVPGLPIRDGTVADAVKAVEKQLSAAGKPFEAPHVPEHGTTGTALILTVMFAALVLSVALRLLWARGVRAATTRAGQPDSTLSVTSVKPSDLEPALAGALVGGGGAGDRSLVAATLLDLARRKVISITGSDTRRFVLTVPQGATGETVFENAVLTELRPPGQPTAAAELTGPPLWGIRGQAAGRRLSRILIREARRRRLVRFNLPAIVVVPVSAAMGVVAISGGDPFGWFVVFAGPLLALAAVLTTGLTLSARGRVEHDQWSRYGDWLRTNGELAVAGAPAVTTLGENLAYAAALGAAPEAARALSPRRGV